MIQVELSSASSRDITVEYQITSATATAAVDFNLASAGLLEFPAGATQTSVPLIVVSDALTEPAETINLALQNNANLVNATLGANTTFTYTIQDYVAFENTGIGGVGPFNEVDIWLRADEIPRLHNAAITNIPDQSNYGNTPTAAAGEEAQLQVTSNTINNRQTLSFDGGDRYAFTDDARINTATVVEAKHIFMVIRTGASVAGKQILYEQGGGGRALNLYIENGRLYWYGYNDNNDDAGATTPWGKAPEPITFVESAVSSIAPNTEYIISAIYDFTATNKLELFINGASVGTPVTANVGRLFSHAGDAYLGGSINGDVSFHDGTNATNTNNFQGLIAELVYYTDDPIITSRRRIIENYLSAEYNIAITNQYHNNGAAYPAQGAGIGQVSGTDYHLDSRGTGIVRMAFPTSANDGDFLFWSHNDSALAWSNVDVPATYSGGERLRRVWRVAETADIGNVSFEIDLTGAVSGNPDEYELLIDDDGVFTNASSFTTGRSFTNNILSFTNVNFTDGQFFTIGVNTSAIATVQNGDWNTASTWNCGCVPNASADVTVNHNVTISSNVAIDSVFVSNTGALNFTNAVSLTITDDLVSNGGFTAGVGQIIMNGTQAQQLITDANIHFHGLVIDNPAGVTLSSAFDYTLDGTLTLTNGALTTNNRLTLTSDGVNTGRVATITGGSIVGSITAQQMMDNVEGYRAIGSPMSGQTFSNINDNVFTTGFPGSDYPAQEFISISYYNEPFAEITDSGYVYPAGINDPMTIGRGYYVYSLGNKIIDFTGSINQGNINLPVSYTSTGFGNTHDGWNLVSNPYPSPVDWESAGWTKGTDVGPIIYQYNPVTQNFGTYNATTNMSASGGSRYIPAFQGFWVKLNGNTSTTLQITENAKVASSQPFFGRTPLPANTLKVIANDGGTQDEMIIGDFAGATNQFDADFDAIKVPPLNPASAYVSSLSQPTKELIFDMYGDVTSETRIPIQYQGEQLRFENNYTFVSFTLLDESLNPLFQIENDTVYNLSRGGSGSTLYLQPNAPVALPVSLLSFEVALNEKAKSATIHWHTASEWQISEYQLYARRNAGDTAFLGNVKAKNIRNREAKYSWIDDQILDGVNQYLLFEKTLDGELNFLESASVFLQDNEEKEYSIRETSSFYEILFPQEIVAYSTYDYTGKHLAADGKINQTRLTIPKTSKPRIIAVHLKNGTSYRIPLMGL